MVGVVAIVAAVALVVSVSVLVTRSDTDNLATPENHHQFAAAGPGRDHHHDTAAAAAPPPPTTGGTAAAAARDDHGHRAAATTAGAHRGAPATAATEAPPPPPAADRAGGPPQVTYSVTGTKAPGDIITVTYVDASGRRRTQRNVYIPWSLTVTPISQSEVGSVQASSLFLVSRLNCSITTSDGTVLSSNTNNTAQTSC